MADSDTKQDVWAQGALYEPFVGRWSRLVAREFVSWLGVRPGKRWLDVGSGTGALSQAILDNAAPESVVGIDLSEGFVQYARTHISDSRATFRVRDAQDLKTDRGAFDAVVSGLVLNFVPSAERMITEMSRACRLNGRVAVYVWDYAGGMQMLKYFWDTAIEFDPAARARHEAARFDIADLKKIWNLFLDASLNDVTTRTIEVQSHFQDFDDYWNPFLGGQGPAAGYAMSLDEEKRSALRDLLRQRLPQNADGSIDLIARALAVKGTR